MRDTEVLRLQFEGGERRFYWRPQSEGDKGVIQQIFANRDYDLSTFPQWADVQRVVNREREMGRRPLVLDAGANIGASCVHFAMAFPGAHVVGVEPEPGNCNLLSMNCEALSVDLIEGAIGSETTKMFLIDPGLSDWGFRVQEESGAKPYQVDVFTVPEILSRYSSSTYFPFICKIDIEGGEGSLFEKNVDWINDFTVLIIELHDWLFPGKAVSRTFLRAIGNGNFDFLYRGENVFCFNNRRAVFGSGTQV